MRTGPGTVGKAAALKRCAGATGGASDGRAPQR
jgi:hypothetical protein